MGRVSYDIYIRIIAVKSNHEYIIFCRAFFEQASSPKGSSLLAEVPSLALMHIVIVGSRGTGKSQLAKILCGVSIFIVNSTLQIKRKKEERKKK